MDSDYFQRLVKNSCSLFEFYKEDFIKYEMPEEMPLKSILEWQKNIGGKGLLISDRIQAFKYRAPTENLHKHPKWLKAFKEIIESYKNPFYDQAKRYLSNENQKIGFGVLLYPFVDFACRELESIVSQNNALIQQHSLESSRHMLLQQLSQAASFCFNEHYRTYLDSKMESLSSDTLNDYCNDFYSDNVFSFFEKYSVLAKALSLITLRWIGGIKDVIVRLKGDKSLLLSEKLLTGEPAVISELIVDGGITHAQTGPTIILHFKDNQSIVYKSKSSVNEQIFTSIIEFINKLDKLKLKPYRTIDKIDYSWHEFIPYKSCDTIKEVQDFYFRIGFYSALMQVLSSSDYHYGNIMAYGSQPLFIDHETLFKPFEKSNGFSFRTSNILACTMGDDLADESYLLGAFHSKAELAIRKCTKNKDGHTKSILINEVWKGKNIAMLDDKAVNPLSFCSEIIKGYREGLNVIKSNKEAFLDSFQAQLHSLELRYRYIPRPSKTYHEMLNELWDPAFMSSGKERSMNIDRLFSIRKNSDPDWKIKLTEMETVFLDEFCLPRFFYSEAEWSDFGLTFEVRPRFAFYNQVRDNISILEEEDSIREYVGKLENYFADFL